MSSEIISRIEDVDQVRDGIAITFSDAVTVFYPADFMFAIWDHERNRRLLPAENGY